MQNAFATDAVTTRKSSSFQKHKRAIATCKVMVCLALLTGTLPIARGETPPVPPEITPPAGNVLFLTAHAVGTQNYMCLPSTAGGGNTWVFFSPQATLSITFLGRFNQQVVTHYLSPVPGLHSSPPPACTLSGETDQVNCPTWQSSLDSVLSEALR